MGSTPTRIHSPLTFRTESAKNPQVNRETVAFEFVKHFIVIFISL
jgi:hypothetical protein